MYNRMFNKIKVIIIAVPLFLGIFIGSASDVFAATMSNNNTWGYNTLYKGQFPYFFQEYVSYSEDYYYTTSIIYFGDRKSYISLKNGKNLPFGSDAYTTPYTQYYGNNTIQATAKPFVYNNDDPIIYPAEDIVWWKKNVDYKSLDRSYSNKYVEHVGSLDLGTSTYPRIFTPKLKFTF